MLRFINVCFNNYFPQLAVLLLFGGMTPLWAANFDASLVWLHRVELGTPVSGVINEVKVVPGDVVQKGQALLRLDPRGFQARLKMAQAQHKSLQEKRAEAKRELERAEELYERTVLSDHDLQTAKNSYIEADAEYKGAEAALVQARLDLEYSTLSAPFNAVVLERFAQLGQTVSADLQPVTLLVVAEANKMLARTYVDIEQANILKKNSNASVTVNDNQYTASVFSVGLEPVPEENDKYVLDVIFDTGKLQLRAGQEAVIELP